jgi:hypothetical protein
MARRVPGYGDGAGGLVLIVVGAALYYAFPIIAAAIVYGTFTGLIVGLIVAESRARPRPAITSEKQLESLKEFSDDEKSAIQSLAEQGEELFRRRAELYWEGDQAGLVRRQSDGRFDARKGGRSINARLAKLDTHFEAIEDEIASIKLNSAYRSQQQANEFSEWRSKYALAVAFRSALGAYIVCAVGLAIYNPPLLQQVSQFIAQRVWLYLPWLAAIYGPLVIASAVAIAAVLFLKDAAETSIEFQTDWIQEQREENISKFVTAEDVTEPEYAEESGPWGHANADADEDENDDQPQSPYEVLGVAVGATRNQIMAAYRELIKQYHPDFQQNRGPKLRELAEQESQLLNWAKDEALKRC